MPIDYPELENALHVMKPRQKLYELIKKEMQRRDRWKQEPRGTGFKKGHDDRRVKLQRDSSTEFYKDPPYGSLGF